MKHTACGGWIEIRTDPKSSEYVVTEGARRRDYGDNALVAERVGGVLLGGDEEEADRKRQDAFTALEGKVEDKVRAKSEAARLEELRSIKERDWRDVDAANRRLRAGFRTGRKEREKDEKISGALADKLGLGIEIVAEREEDVKRAALVEFGTNVTGGDLVRTTATRTPMFTVNHAQKHGSSRIKPANEALRDSLHHELTSNTRAVVDPFQSNVGLGTLQRGIPGVKPRRQESTLTHEATSHIIAEQVQSPSNTTSMSANTTFTDIAHTELSPTDGMKPSSALVAYDSD